MTHIDVAKGAKALGQHLKDQNFRPRDADPTDFQYGTDPGLRFKIGTVYGEVTISAWKHARQFDILRVLSDAQVVEAKHWIDRHVHQFFEGRRG